MTIYVNTNDSKRPRIDRGTSFFCMDYPADAAVSERAVALQGIVDKFTAALEVLASHRLPADRAVKAVEEVWQETVAIVRQLDGESAAKTQSVRATAAPTSAPSDDASDKKESLSSTKRKATQSASQPAGSTTVQSAAAGQPSE